MDERLRFVARVLEGEKMAPLCAEIGISRMLGYKIFERYKDCGIAAFTPTGRQFRSRWACRDEAAQRRSRAHFGRSRPRSRFPPESQALEFLRKFGLPAEALGIKSTAHLRMHPRAKVGGAARI
jgi:hypothetical protein